LETVLLICRAWHHVTWCWDWVKSGLGCREVYRLFFTIAIGVISQPRAPAVLPLGKDARGALVEVTPVCEPADAHKPPHVLGTGCHRWTRSRGSVPEFHLAAVELHFLLWQATQSWCMQSDTWGTVTVLPCGWFYALNLNVLLLMVDVRLWVSVQFLAQARSFLWTCR
jgi:hypothetical protein